MSIHFIMNARNILQIYRLFRKHENPTTKFNVRIAFIYDKTLFFHATPAFFSWKST